MTSLNSTDNGSTSITTNVTVKTFLNSSGITTPVTNLSDAGSQSMTINNALTTAPLFFVRSGGVSSNSTLFTPGQNAYYWSRSSYSNANVAFYLTFNNSNVSPSDDWDRYRGFSLRCLYAI